MLSDEVLVCVAAAINAHGACSITLHASGTLAKVFQTLNIELSLKIFQRSQTDNNYMMIHYRCLLGALGVSCRRRCETACMDDQPMQLGSSSDVALMQKHEKPLPYSSGICGYIHTKLLLAPFTWDIDSKAGKQIMLSVLMSRPAGKTWIMHGGGTDLQEIATLNHEALDDSMEL